MNLHHALGLSGKPTGLPAPKPAAKTEPATRWLVRWHLDGELEVYGCSSEEAAREARTALEDIQARVDAMPNVWSAGGDLEAPEAAR